MSESSFPEPLQWNGDEPDPYRDEAPDEQRCSFCGYPSSVRGCACDADYDPTTDPEVSE